MSSRSSSLYPWFMWTLGTLFFFAHYYARVSPSMIVSDLMHDFHVGAAAIGQLAAAFYVPYVCAQIPYGMLVDRFGVRIPLSVCVLTAGVALFAFSQAESIETCFMTRFLFGIFAASGFISSVKLAAMWLPPHRMALAVGLTQGAGMLGGIVGTQVIALALTYLPWRAIMSAMATSYIVLAVLLLLFLRNAPQTDAAQSSRASRSDNLSVVTSWPTWMGSLFCGLIFAPMQVFGESWGAHYLEAVHQFSRLDAGSAMSMVFFGWCLGGPSAGYLADRLGRIPVMRWSALFGTLSMTLLLYYPMSLLMTQSCVFLFGLTNAGLVAAYAVVGELHPPRSAGLALSLANMFTILVGAGLSPLVGWLLDWFWKAHPLLVEGIHVYAAADYHQAFAMLPLCSLAAGLVTLFIPETLKKHS